MKPPPRMSTPSNQKPKGWIQRFLKGTDDHFVCFLPQKLSFLAAAILKTFYSGITIDPHQIKRLQQIPDQAIVVYVNKHKSKFDFLFCHTLYRQLGVRPPEIGFEYHVLLWQPLSRLLRIGLAKLHYFVKYFSFPNPYRRHFYRNALLNGHTGFLSLVDKGDFHRRFIKAKTDPIRYLIEMQMVTDRPIFLVPTLIFFSKNPPRAIPGIVDILFGPESRPGRIRKLATLFRKPGKVFAEVSHPVELPHFLSEDGVRARSIELQSLILRRSLLLQLNRHRQSITGPVLKSREELKEAILTHERFQDFMKKHAESRSMPIHTVRQKAESDLNEIAASFSPGFIQLASVIVRWIINSMFDGFAVNDEQLDRIKAMARRGPLILIPCHKSHVDYLILSYVLYHHNLPPPHIAAGKNLSFWPLGTIFRLGGAFFLRRTFRGAVLYSKVFSEYLYKMLQEGFNIEFFIEGTRSRTGKLFLPKLGLLSMIVDAYRAGACEDMIIVPIYIGYDRVIEEGAYIRELEGGQKEPENLLQVIKARKFLKKRYGKIYIQFNQPFSLAALLGEQGIDLTDAAPKIRNQFVRHLGMRVTNAIDQATVVTAHGLVAAALLNCPKPRFSDADLKFIVDTYLKYLHHQNTQLADTLLTDQDRAIDNAIESYQHQKIIEWVAKKKSSARNRNKYQVNPAKRPGLEYYKNNCISLFIPAAYTAAEILHLDAFQFTSSDLHEGFFFLQEFFKNEFVIDQEQSPEYLVRKSIKYFIDDATLIPHQTLPDTYNLTAMGLRKLKLYAAFLKSYFESYQIVLTYFSANSKEDAEGRERLKKVEALGKRMYKSQTVERIEALSKVTYGNAIDYFSGKGIKGSENIDKINHYTGIVTSYLNYL